MSFAAYGGVFITIIAVIAASYQAPQPMNGTSSVASATQTPVATPDSIDDQPSIDKIIATDVAANLAEQTNMPVAPNVANLSVSLAVENELAQTDDTAIVKPQIVQPLASSRDIITYIVKKGDTIDSIAAAYGVTAETIRWANDLTGNSVSVGKKLKIPPVDGIMYTVKSGDTLDALAQTYSTSKARIVSFNNLEISGLKPGTKILIPGGNLPENQRPGYTEPVVRQIAYINTGTGFGGSSWRIKVGTPGYTGNGYAFGNCTRYAYDRRVELGLPVGGQWGNASTWAYFAASEGYVVNNTPAVGAIIQNGGGYGHVGIVERIRSNGDVEISEMNAYVAGGGWNIVNARVIPAAQAKYYAYIH